MAKRKSWRDYVQGFSGSTTTVSEKTVSWRDYIGKGSSVDTETYGSWRMYTTSEVGDSVTKNIVSRVNTLFTEQNTLVEDYKVRYQGRKGTYEDSYVSDSADWLSSVTAKKDHFDTEAASIKALMEQYSDTLDKDWADQVMEALATSSDNYQKILESSTKDNDFWSLFGSEGNYGQWQDYVVEEGPVKNLWQQTETAKKQADTAYNSYLSAKRTYDTFLKTVPDDIPSQEEQVALQAQHDALYRDVQDKYAAYETSQSEYTVLQEQYTTSFEELQMLPGYKWGELLARSDPIRDVEVIQADIDAVDAQLDTLPFFGATEEKRKLQDEKALLEEEQYWSKHVAYAALTGKPDFAEKSTYVPRPTENKPSAFEIMTDNVSEEDSGWEDPLYEYINGNTEAGAFLYNQARNYYGTDNALGALLGAATFSKSESQEMTQEEVQIFNYLYNTEGKGAAHSYYAYLQEELNYRQRKSDEAYWSDDAQRHPVRASVFSVVTSPMKGLSYVGQIADYIEDGEIDQNAGYNKFSYTNTAIRETVSKQIKQSGRWGEVGSYTYQLGMGMGDFLMTMAVSGGNQALSLAIMGTSAAADATIAAKDRGLSNDQAFALGTIAGIAEVLTERWSLATLLDKVSLGKSLSGYIMKNALTGGLEEVSSSAVNLIADIMISKDKSQWQQSIDAYVQQGKTESEAFGLALADQAMALGLDFVGGVITETAMAGGYAAVNTAVQYVNKATNRAGGNITGRGAAENNTALSSTTKLFPLDTQKIQDIQSIGRKSVSQFTQQDVQKTAALASNYAQELGKKSPFYRAQHGDWRVNDQTPVQIAKQPGDARGIQKNLDTGWDIQVSGKVFNESRHAAAKNQAALKYLPYINDIVNKAVLLDSYAIGETKSGNSLMMHSMYAVADIGKGPEVLKLFVEEINNPNGSTTIKRAYQIQNMGDGGLEVQGSRQTASPIIQTTAIQTVADLYQAVKQADKNFSVNYPGQAAGADAVSATEFSAQKDGTAGEDIAAMDSYLAALQEAGYIEPGQFSAADILGYENGSLQYSQPAAPTQVQSDNAPVTDDGSAANTEMGQGSALRAELERHGLNSADIDKLEALYDPAKNGSEEQFARDMTLAFRLGSAGVPLYVMKGHSPLQSLTKSQLQTVRGIGEAFGKARTASQQQGQSENLSKNDENIRTNVLENSDSDGTIKTDTSSDPTVEKQDLGNEPVNIVLKFMESWSPIQREQAIQKVQALTNAKTVKRAVERSKSSAAKRFKTIYGRNSVQAGYDIDHIIDLQLGGIDDISNMMPLDRSVNRSLGAQIMHAIKDYPPGTVFGTFTIQ